MTVSRRYDIKPELELPAVKTLARMGMAKGNLTEEEIQGALSDIDLSEAQLESVYGLFADAGISIGEDIVVSRVPDVASEDGLPAAEDVDVEEVLTYALADHRDPMEVLQEIKQQGADEEDSRTKKKRSPGKRVQGAMPLGKVSLGKLSAKKAGRPGYDDVRFSLSIPVDNETSDVLSVILIFQALDAGGFEIDRKWLEGVLPPRATCHSVSGSGQMSAADYGRISRWQLESYRIHGA